LINGIFGKNYMVLALPEMRKYSFWGRRGNLSPVTARQGRYRQTAFMKFGYYVNRFFMLNAVYLNLRRNERLLDKRN